MTVIDPSPAPLADPVQDRLKALLQQHGELMTGRDLIGLFRYGSERAFRRAAIAGRLPIAVMRLDGRPGWFARTRDVARWLDEFDLSMEPASSKPPTP